MSPRQPVVSGERLIKALRKEGWEVVRRDQGVVLIHVFSVYPTQMRLPELVRELTNGSSDFAEGDGIERAIRDLISVGLLFVSGALVLPTRAALRFHEILEDPEVGLS